MKKNNLELYAIRYGQSLFPSKHIFKNDPYQKNLEFIWLFYLIRYQDKLILTDTGFSETGYIRRFDLEYTDPLDLLKTLDISPQDITDIILTHTHFDHVGNVHKFNNARIIIQKDELDHYISKASNRVQAHHLKTNSCVMTFENEYLLYDRIRIIRTGGHTIGSSIIRFTNKRQEYIIAGDEFYFLENLEKGIPSGITFSLQKNRALLEQLTNLLSDSNPSPVILTFHDPRLIAGNSPIQKIIP